MVGHPGTPKGFGVPSFEFQLMKSPVVPEWLGSRSTPISNSFSQFGERVRL